MEQQPHRACEQQNQNQNKTKSRHIQIDHWFFFFKESIITFKTLISITIYNDS